jgi:hypothetical protein
MMNTITFPNSDDLAIEALRELGVTHQEGSPEDALISAIKTHQDLNQRYPKLAEYMACLTTWLQYLPPPQKELNQTDHMRLDRSFDLVHVLNEILQEKTDELNELNASNVKQGLDREAYTYSDRFLANEMQGMYSDIRIEEILIKNELYRRLKDLGNAFRVCNETLTRQFLRDNELCQLILSQRTPVKIFK